MSIPLTVTLFDPGSGGAPTTNNPYTLRTLDSYDHSIVNEVGFESMTAKYRTNLVAAVDMLNRLMSGVVVTNPLGRSVWEGYVAEVQLELGSKTVVVSLADMANRIRVRYSTDAGAQGGASLVQSTASQSRYGIKDRLINFGTTTAAAATNRASVVLNQIAYPRCKQRSSAKTDKRSPGVTVTLVCKGWWDTLDWVLVTNASTSVTQTTTQLTALLTAYNLVNAFFSTSTANITASGVSDTEYVEGDSTYAEKIATILAAGNAAQQRLAWGCYEGRAITVRQWAGATPSAITYTQSASDHTIRDAYGNVVEPWDARPDAMVQLVDLVEPAPATGPIDTIARQYIKRVSVRLDRTSREVTLEPDDVDSLEELLTRPTGRGPSGTSARQAAIERTTKRQLAPHYSPTNGKVDAGGGSIRNPGGGDVDLSTGTGIGGGGSSGVTTSGGTPGAVAKWVTGSTLGDAVAGTDYAAASHTHAASAIVSGTIATARLGSGTANNTTFLRGDQTWATISAGTVGGTGTAGRIAQWATGGADIENSTLIKSGTGVLTLATAANTMTVTFGASGGTLNLAGNTLTLGPDLTTSGAGATITLAAAGAYTLTIPATGTAALGTGTTNRVAYWSGTNSLAAYDALRVDNSNNRLGINTTPNKTLEVNGDCIVGGGLISASLASGLTAGSGQIHAENVIISDVAFRTGGNPNWAFGAYTADVDAAAVGYLTVNVGGTNRKIMVRA